MLAPSRTATCVLVIPARRKSTRLRDKLLLRADGKTVLQHTHEAACRAELPECILIATDDEDIAWTARRFGAAVVMTSAECPSGTDRVAEAIAECPHAEIIVNLQGDEPEIDPAAIDRLIASLQSNPTAAMATLAAPIRDRATLEDPSCVKVVFDQSGRALYFSRSPIPHVREWDEWLLQTTPAQFHQHIGVYAYRRELLLKLASLPPGRTEQLEKLEQLRVLEHGEMILVTETDASTRGIDTPDDYAAFVARRRAG
ncbi:MAG: 3-deoxy-manno-octulosonate cytidylyltransferase [Pirellulales bacterium]|nr:3-deoxy-manno-octulosonate cytidylyltransferase [Pirellulales bacterium]